MRITADRAPAGAPLSMPRSLPSLSSATPEMQAPGRPSIS